MNLSERLRIPRNLKVKILHQGVCWWLTQKTRRPKRPATFGIHSKRAHIALKRRAQENRNVQLSTFNRLISRKANIRFLIKVKERNVLASHWIPVCWALGMPGENG